MEGRVRSKKRACAEIAVKSETWDNRLPNIRGVCRLKTLFGAARGGGKRAALDIK